MFRYFITGSLALLLSGLAVAQNAMSGPDVSLEELLRLALQKNPQIPAARLSQEAARLRHEALRARPGATLEIVPGLGSREAADEQIILAQPLDVFGKRRAQADVAAAELRLAQAQTTLAERALIVEVKNAAALLFVAQEAESLAAAQEDIAQQFHKAASRRAQLGEVPAIQMQRAELELLRAQNELSATQAERAGRRARLNQLIGREPNSPLLVTFAVAGLASTSNPQSSTPQSSTPQSSNPPMRPDILAAQAGQEIRRAEVEVARRDGKPEVVLQARRAAFFGREGSYALRAVITVPLFDNGSRQATRLAAQAEASAQESEVALLKSQAAAQVAQARIGWEQHRQSVEKFRTGIVPLTVELLRKTQVGYDAGASTQLEVLEAQRALRQTQGDYLKALTALRLAENSLESALGFAPGGQQ